MQFSGAINEQFSPGVDKANSRVSGNAVAMASRHTRIMDCLHCDLSELLEQTRPPDSGFVGLIEKAFLERQIDCLTADLAYLWILAKKG